MAIRKSFIVYPKFQFTLIITNLVTSLFLFSFVAIENKLAFRSLREMGAQAQLDLGHPYYKFLMVQSATIFSHLAVAFVVGTFLSFLATVYFSHRMAGPLVRLKQYFYYILIHKKVPRGGLRFRRNDYLSEIAYEINSAFRAIEEKANESVKNNSTEEISEESRKAA